jgi:hypothetical protein
MSEFPTEERGPDNDASYIEIVNNCIEKLALIARDIEFKGQDFNMDPKSPTTVVDFAAHLRKRLSQLKKDEKDLSIQESMIENIENIISQLILLSGLVKQFEAKD